MDRPSKKQRVGDAPKELAPLKVTPIPTEKDTMQIYVNMLSGKTITFNVEPNLMISDENTLKPEYVREMEFEPSAVRGEITPGGVRLLPEIARPTSAEILGSLYDAASLSRPSMMRAEKAALALEEYWKSEAGRVTIAKLNEVEMGTQYMNLPQSELVSMNILETSRFLLLKFTHSDTLEPEVDEDGNNVGCAYSPSYRIDQVWHEMMLNPRAYTHKLCVQTRFLIQICGLCLLC